ncbi:MAG: HAD family phosphatase [Hungatella sp.]|nr:HAD family phosphatase [Hungatella sp.]
MIKLIATDIDGTLLRDGEHHLNPEYFDVILKLRQKGIQFAAASGRQWASIEAVFEPVKEKVFYLSDNGAYVGCHGRNLFLNPIDRDIVLEMIRRMRQIPGLEIIAGGPDVVYTETKNQEFLTLLTDGYRFRVRQVEDLTEVSDYIIKVSVYRKSGIQGEAEGLTAEFGDRVKMVLAGEWWLDAMAPGVSKGQAIGILQENLDIKPEETMAFGDQMNDIEMLKRAYYSFAVANAREEVKQAARFQADTNERDGVLKVLRQLL